MVWSTVLVALELQSLKHRAQKSRDRGSLECKLEYQSKINSLVKTGKSRQYYNTIDLIMLQQTGTVKVKRVIHIMEAV